MNRKDILAMVQEGTITAEEAVKLLEVMEDEPNTPTLINRTKQTGIGKMLKVIVDSKEDGKNSKVRINVPIAFIKLAVATGKGLDINGMNLGDKVDIDVIMKAIDDGLVGEIVNVESDDAFVQIVIE